MSGLELGSGDISGAVISVQSGGGGLIVFFPDCVLGDISIVISLHLQVEDLGFGVLLIVDQLAVQKVDDVVAEVRQLLLDLLLVVLQELEVGGLVSVLGFLLLFDG